jgi:hypothetical protein
MDKEQRDRRDLFIAAVATGMLTSGRTSSDAIPGLAVKIADALLAEADKAKPKPREES